MQSDTSDIGRHDRILSILHHRSANRARAALELVSRICASWNQIAAWLRAVHSASVHALRADDTEMQALSARELLDRFKQEKVFWRQFDIGQALAATNDRGAMAELEGWLTHDDRHLRGNAAFVLGRLGDSRGFQTIAGILADRSARSADHGIPVGNWSVQAQIRADRYYAAHLLGDLKDPRGVGLLIPLLNDKDVDDIVPWSLAEIGDRRAIEPLIKLMERDDPSVQVLAISGGYGRSTGFEVRRDRTISTSGCGRWRACGERRKARRQRPL